MNMHRVEDTVSLWNSSGKKKITLKNLLTGMKFSFELKQSFTIGRKKEECDMQITDDDRYISGKHLRFIKGEDGVYVEDLETKNGTAVNGKRIRAKTRVRSGDIIRIGRSKFEIMF